MQEEHPVISIVLPTYNRAHLLPRLFHSLLWQSNRRFELVVVDDGSTDLTPRVIEEFRRRFGGRLVWVPHHGNRGCNAARNTGVCAAHTDWCLFVDSDWELFQDSVQRAIHHTHVPQHVGAVGFLSLHLPENVVHGYRARDQTWETAAIPCEEVVLKRNVTGDMFWMIRRSVFCDDGIWLPEWVNGLEPLFGARLARRREIVAVRHVLGIIHFDATEDHISVDQFRKWPNEFRRGYELFIAENHDILRHDIREYRRCAKILARCSRYSGSYWRAVIWALRVLYWNLYLRLRPLVPERLFVRWCVFGGDQSGGAGPRE